MIIAIPLYIALAFTVGCANISEVSHIVLDNEGYTVTRKMTSYRTPGAVSPSVVTSITEECRHFTDNSGVSKCNKVAGYSTGVTGYLPSLVGGAAAVGSAHLIGKGLSESGSGNSTNIESSSEAGAVSVQEQSQ